MTVKAVKRFLAQEKYFPNLFRTRGKWKACLDDGIECNGRTAAAACTAALKKLDECEKGKK